MEEDRSELLGALFQDDGLPSAEFTEKIIGCAYRVSNALGSGFLEKLYENALTHELDKAEFAVEQQKRINVMYDGILVGFYDADIVVDNCVNHRS